MLINNNLYKGQQQNFGMALTMRTIENLTHLSQNREKELGKIAPLIVKAGTNTKCNVDSFLACAADIYSAEVYITSNQGSRMPIKSQLIPCCSFDEFYNSVKKQIEIAKKLQQVN